MFRLEAVSVCLGGREIFNNLTWQVGSHDRVGLVGANGAGKTTLLRILSGQLELDKGTSYSSRSATFGYLPQEGIVHRGKTVFQEAISVFGPILKIKKRQNDLLSSLENAQADSSMLEKLLTENQRLEDEFTNADGYQIERDVGIVLKGLGFEKADWDRLTETYSGGWQMRIALAKLLLQRPSLLLLDEPTNHLDLEAREWLANYLRSYPHAIVLVSHDQFFLDQTVARIASLGHGCIEDYVGNYSYYVKEKQHRQESQLAAFTRQQEEIARIESFIERFRYKASKASQVQSRVKALQKLDRLPSPEDSSRSVRFRFPEPPRSGDTPIELIGVGKRYGENQVLLDVNLRINRGDCVALVGPNGAGKSTLMRLLAGIEPCNSGSRRLGHNGVLGYFAQDQATTLNPENTVIQEMAEVAPLGGDSLLRSLLGSFLFSGDDIYKRVGILSGGERNRLALCKLLSKANNLLLLDEPTNHLDIASKNVLLEAMRTFTGTVVFVSHDRSFVEGLASRIVEVGGGGIYDYPGNYTDFRIHQSRLANQEQLTSGDDSQSIQLAKVSSGPELSGSSADIHRARKQASRHRARQKGRLKRLEREIESSESDLKVLEAKMHDPMLALEYEELMRLQQEHSRLSKTIDQRYHEWTELTEQKDEHEGHQPDIAPIESDH